MSRREPDSVELVSALLLPTLLLVLCLVTAGVMTSVFGLDPEHGHAARVAVLAVACPLMLALTFYRLRRGGRLRE